MSLGDDIKRGAEKAMGKAKEGLGDLTGNKEAEREGKAEQLEADAKKKGDELREGAEDLVDSAKAKIEDLRRD
ncbi:MAG TPA: CsbD family protein [Actinomycetaceae bacterium]|nr:CsbD family protein [Actinomycetaceae bacterium]